MLFEEQQKAVVLKAEWNFPTLLSCQQQEENLHGFLSATMALISFNEKRVVHSGTRRNFECQDQLLTAIVGQKLFSHKNIHTKYLWGTFTLQFYGQRFSNSNEITKLTCKTSEIVGSIAAQQPLFFLCVAIPIHNEDIHR